MSYIEPIDRGWAGMSAGEAIEQTRRLVLERIRTDTSFVVATHEHPDGDALGSLIGMHGLLHGARQEL